MADPVQQGSPAGGGGPSPQELEERWKETIDALTESPRNVDVVIKAGQLSEQLGRPHEAFNYYRKALTLDPSKSFLATKLRAVAITPEQKDEVTKYLKRPASFPASLATIYSYPVRGKGLPVLLLGAAFMWVARVLVRGGIGLSGVSLAGLASAYMAMFYIDVCHTTIGGEDHLPDWPDPLRLTEFISDVAKFFMAGVSAFLPVILLFLVFGLGGHAEPAVREIPDFQMKHSTRTPASPAEDEATGLPAPSVRPGAPVAPTVPVAPAAPLAPSLPPGLIVMVAAGLLLGILGILYVPMATLANVVMGSCWTCFNFPFVIHSILKTPGNYGICLAMYFGTSLIVGAAETGVWMGGVVVPTGFALAFMELYGMTVLMRLLGLFYRMNQAKLGWMAD
jgi:hypothetical protein